MAFVMRFLFKKKKNSCFNVLLNDKEEKENAPIFHQAQLLTVTLYSQIILQKSRTVLGSGPCVAM